jgi:hypothetical protein
MARSPAEEKTMFKHLPLFAALAVLAPTSVNAQQSDPVWQKVEVPGADFVVVFAITKSSVAPDALRASPDPLVVYPTGSELAFAVEGEVEKQFKDVGAVQFPACAFRVERKGDKPIAAIAYVLPKEETAVAAKDK